MKFSIKNIRYFFWVFILLIILLQLATNKELQFSGALLYTFGVMAVLIMHETIVRRILIEKYQFYQVNAKLIAYNLLLALFSSSLLTGYGYFIFTKFLEQEYLVEINDLLTSMFFGLFLLIFLFQE
ncbi:hypothetical protein [Mesonia maritima]|uniref:Uncharacterized protein n=1 Tax=Mesonia maritima TaxID=1793873 RepID=A0ABU1K8H0_9FLAO|nr:hypothetical protein [Mesonia maritima]MDR6301909.1 hypothetical protein [Mesonia maritima]